MLKELFGCTHARGDIIICKPAWATGEAPVQCHAKYYYTTISFKTIM